MTRRSQQPVDKLDGTGQVRRHGDAIASVRYMVTLTYKQVQRSTAASVQGFAVDGFMTVLDGEPDLGQLDALELHMPDGRWMSVFVLKGDVASGSWHFTLGTGGAGGFNA